MTVCNECDGQCTCHIEPPCSFCVEHEECDVCGCVTCEKDEDTGLCPTCKERNDC